MLDKINQRQNLRVSRAATRDKIVALVTLENWAIYLSREQLLRTLNDFNIAVKRMASNRNVSAAVITSLFSAIPKDVLDKMVGQTPSVVSKQIDVLIEQTEVLKTELFNTYPGFLELVTEYDTLYAQEQVIKHDVNAIYGTSPQTKQVTFNRAKHNAK